MSALEDFRALLTPQGQEALRAAAQLQPAEDQFLSLFQRLSRQYPPNLARTALEIVLLRQKAGSKFPFAEHLYFTRAALEQASNWEVSTCRARRYRGFPFVLDLGCSIGTDTFALGQLVSTIGIDRDPLRLAMAKENLYALGLQDRCQVIQADLLQPLPFTHQLSSTALFFDPARREDERRIYHVDAYHPPLSIIKSWLACFPNLGVKVSPGVKLEELKDYDCEVEFISLHGELKEAVLWFGGMRTACRRATLLPDEASLSIPLDDIGAAVDVPLSPPRQYLLEPDPAVIRAGLVQQVAHLLNAAQLDRQIAYLTASAPVSSPFVRAWRVEDWMPFQLKRLRAYLRQRRVGILTIKKRGSPLDPDTLRRQLRLQGDQERVLFLTQCAGEPVAIIAFPIESDKL